MSDEKNLEEQLVDLLMEIMKERAKNAENWYPSYFMIPPPPSSLLPEMTVNVIRYSILQNYTVGKEKVESTTVEVSETREKFFLGAFLEKIGAFLRQKILRVKPDHCKSPALSSKGFVIHLKGLPLPELCSKEVPPNTVLIAISTEDFLKYNCFEARPVSLEQLRKESQSGESSGNEHHVPNVENSE